MIHNIANEHKLDISDPNLPQILDDLDELKEFRSKFNIPPQIHGDSDKESIYLCGNSLGLAPKSIERYFLDQIHKWNTQGVEGHMMQPTPWLTIDDLVLESMARLVGASPGEYLEQRGGSGSPGYINPEIVLMNTLTTNLHLMFVSFYQPTQTRYKILTEAKSFPSDYILFKTQIEFHGYSVEDALIEVQPRNEDGIILLEDIQNALNEHGDEIALVCFSGVQYYTGQLFDMKSITKMGHEKGCKVGFDLAHAVGNVPLQLHDWDVDFACWCTYKYLNSGAGNIGGCFINSKYAEDNTLKRFGGWWGHQLDDRFQMNPQFIPEKGAYGWRCSNPPIWCLTSLRASLDVFDEVNMDQLRNKSILLTGYLEALIQNELSGKVEIFTPSNPEERGCQLSLTFIDGVEKVFDYITKRGVICDMRKPSVMRIAPTPLYNTFQDVRDFINLVHEAIDFIENNEK